MQAHKALEGIQQLRAKGQYVDQFGLDVIEEKLIESQKFEFDFGEFPVMTPGELESQMMGINLPYLLCYFGLPGVGGVLARDHEDAVLIQVFMRLGDQVGMLPPNMPIAIDKRDGSICCMNEDPEIQREWTDPKDKGVFAVISLICLVIRGLAVLNCSNVKVVDNPAPDALNRKRAKQGKPPLFTYKTLHIKPPTSGAGRAGGSSGDRNLPRLHLRRGHIRRLPTGTTTWVQSCMVGSAANGMVMKDYRATN